MKLKEFLSNLSGMVMKDSSILELEVVYSRDDEGNGFQAVGDKPTVGSFDNDDGDFDSGEEFTDKPNAICIN